MLSIKEESLPTHKQYSLTNIEKDSLSRELLQAPSPYEKTEEHLVQTTKAFYQNLSSDLLIDIKNFSRDPSSSGFMLIDNLPVGDLPATPTNGATPSADRQDFIAESISLGLGSLLGDPIGYKWEKDSLLPHHVIPMPGGEFTQSNQGSKVFLNYHNDMVYDDSLTYNKYNPDFIVLLCAKPDPKGDAETRYADARKILTLLTQAEIASLCEPVYQMASPSNYSRLISPNSIKWSKPQSIISGSSRFPEIALGANGVRTKGKKNEAVLKKLYDICNDPIIHTGIKLKTGQALLINNRKGVHARTKFEPTKSSNERWLVRANVRVDLWSMRNRIDADFRRYA